MNAPTRRAKTTVASNTGSYAPFARDEDDSVDLVAAAQPSAEADLSTWTPAEIDTALADLYYTQAKARARRDSDYDHLAGEIARRVYNRGWRANASREEVREHLEAIDEKPVAERDVFDREFLSMWERVEAHQDEIDEALMAMEPYETEYDRRPWPRAFLVTNTGGHVHSSMRCSTCFETTRYHWVTEMSGKSEDEIVDAAASRACTVCFPSAPVETLNKPTSLFTPDEIEKAKAREEREAAKVERERKKIEKSLTVDGSEFGILDHGRREWFKTEQAATTWAVGRIVDHRTWVRGDMPADTAESIEAVKDAIAAKHAMTGAEVEAMIEKKVAAKIKRDGY